MNAHELLEAIRVRCLANWPSSSEAMFREFVDEFFGKRHNRRDFYDISDDLIGYFYMECEAALSRLGQKIDNTDPDNTRIELNWIMKTVREQIHHDFDLNLPEMEIKHKDNLVDFRKRIS